MVHKLQLSLEKSISKILIIIFFLTFYPVLAQEVYVDCYSGDDNNPGTAEAPLFSIKKAVEIIKSRDNNIYTIKINPGIYVLEKHVSIFTEKKTTTDKRITLEANILPDDTAWGPEKMPLIISTAKKGELPESYNFVAAFLINESHVSIRGLKFHGYFYPNTRYFPIARFNKSKRDLLVEQCMFVGDKDASHIQAGIIAHGDEIKIGHCVFYNAKNAVVFWQDSENGIKTGNSFTNNIVYGGFQTAVWTAWPDKDFVFNNNIITNCKHVWIKNSFNRTKYSLDNSVIVNNQHYQGILHDPDVKPEKFEILENNIVREGEVLLCLPVGNVDEPLPHDYLHVLPGTPGFDIGAGLFNKSNTVK